MPISTVTTKGQITIPKSVREALGLTAGSKVAFQIHEDASVSMSTKHERATELLGLIPYDGPPLTLEDMDEAIAEGATSS
ncbi:type II toxin-antitoxin system PrlF family antitoxin [Brachybacterium muris]|uniref:AbrB family transcriptional regulator n=1 Tax=Brachybacterium muris UCD-AY4 TaxID=1249481 RepID=A0A022KX88_9MICO|nr:type II toxin-antitoxin system PrlF family antitoxin [Brachybacterium muris]EYT50496.1 AbrB family transcriptional regulator [Brachybacterium muris UCD-AY4]MCT1429231.1 type II toxin-antitoxin system PrlF family antitoxin [Brachybacterium muris]MCT1998576.1 type II toxin-antitoxin system PrlF family antitoxin [Brachybacterium muris]MCT2178263.1 type II toxin-antitoxin system PrlF family antitoxin [Brachybacterium muris]MCT2261554.1 type II toxin-antitoxin system PrlF family antitoxin [Brach